jgi:hypothetical protein
MGVDGSGFAFGQKAKEKASSPLQGDEPGGMDLNPDHFDFKVEASGSQPPVTINFENILNDNLQGLTPVIIQIVPASLPLFLSELKNSNDYVAVDLSM